MRCVKQTLRLAGRLAVLVEEPAVLLERATGIVRAEVAVGTWRLASMFSAMRRAPPRIGWGMSPGRMPRGRRGPPRLGSVRASVRPWPSRPRLRGRLGRRGRRRLRPRPPASAPAPGPAPRRWPVEVVRQPASTRPGPAGTARGGRARRRSCRRSR